MSADSVARAFVQCLQSAEASRNVAPLVDLFAEDAIVGSIGLKEPGRGHAAAAEFWAKYLATFRRIRSEFQHTHAAGVLCVLEWRSQGELADGSPIDYRGVSILELIGDRIRRFEAYYDSAAFVPNGWSHLDRK